MATTFCASYFGHIEHRVLVTKLCALSFIEASQHYAVSCQWHPPSCSAFATNINVRCEILDWNSVV